MQRRHAIGLEVFEIAGQLLEAFQPRLSHDRLSSPEFWVIFTKILHGIRKRLAEMSEKVLRRIVTGEVGLCRRDRICFPGIVFLLGQDRKSLITCECRRWWKISGSRIDELHGHRVRYLSSQADCFDVLEASQGHQPMVPSPVRVGWICVAVEQGKESLFEVRMRENDLL